MQWPLGWWSDRSDRRYVIAALAGATALVSIAILLASVYVAENFLLLAFAAWGGTALCVYSVCVAHACDIVEPDQIVSTVGTLLFSWATGVTIGPLSAPWRWTSRPRRFVRLFGRHVVHARDLRVHPYSHDATQPGQERIRSCPVDQSRRRIIDLSAQIHPHARELAHGNRK